MSTGAVYALIANDGKADALLTASRLLAQRIKDIMATRRAQGFSDVTPTLADIEQTHILFVNAHFKPFVAIGFEYNKIKPQAGNSTLGGGVTFSIPQFGDFFHDMVCRVRLGQFYGNSGLTPAQGSASFPYNSGTDFYNIVDSTGQVLVQGTTDPSLVSVSSQSQFSLRGVREIVVTPNPQGQYTYRNFVRYCEYPGNRLFRQVKFDVNGNPLDQYSDTVTCMLEKFCIPHNKRTGHDRLVGQEVPLTGYSGLCLASATDEDADSTPQGITRSALGQSNQTVSLFHTNDRLYGGMATGTSVLSQTSLASLNSEVGPHVDVSRKLHQVVNGPQTPKPVQPPLEIWNKLRFWFNDDVRLSIPSVSIPFGQRFITVDMCQQSLLAYEFPSIYLQHVSDDGATRAVSYSPIFQKFGTTEIAVERMELYVNNIFVNPEIHDIYIKRIGFSLIRVYREQVSRCNQESADEKLLSQLKWPIEYMFVGLRPVWNIKDVTVGSGGVVSGGNQNQWRDWHRLTRMVDAKCDGEVVSEMPSGASAPTLKYKSSSVMPDQYYLPVPTVDSLTLTSHGITIFDGFSDNLFNQYFPFHYGGSAINTPEDHGALFVNLALFPRTYQPSGHLNFSRARETYLKFTTSYVSAKTPADLIVVGIAINFLLVTDGSAVLRYST
jgi:hypothetical protein